MYRRFLVCACAVYAHCTCLRMCVCLDTSVYIYAQVSSSLLKYVKDIPHRMSGTFNKHSSLAIFDEHLGRQTNQGLPKILPQYPGS